MGTEEPRERKPSRSKVVIYYHQAIDGCCFSIQDAEGTIITSSLYDNEDECRKDIQRVKKIFKNKFMKIEVQGK